MEGEDSFLLVERGVKAKVEGGLMLRRPRGRRVWIQKEGLNIKEARVRKDLYQRKCIKRKEEKLAG